MLDPLRQASRTTSTSDTVDIVKRTLQSALNKTQSMFNPAYQEFRFKDFSPGKKKSSVNDSALNFA